jgi:hypothetical protein
VYIHSHPDLLGISLFAYGDLLLGDRGVPNYYGPHSGEMGRSAAHSCLVVDRQDMKTIMPELLLFETGDRANLWQCRSRGYQHLGVVHTRTIVQLKDGRGLFLVIDQVQRTTKDPRQLDLYWHAFQPDLRIESPQRVVMGTKPALTIVSAAGNGEVRRGTEWSVTLEDNMAAVQRPYVAYGKTTAVDTSFCSVLAPDPRQPRRVLVETMAGGPDTVDVRIEEGSSRYRVLVVPQARAEREDTLAPGWLPLAGQSQPVRVYSSVSAPSVPKEDP